MNAALLKSQLSAEDLAAIEQVIFGKTARVEESPALFILGSPRTGSTFLYQAVVSNFGLPFIDNLTNNFFPRTPVIGLALGSMLHRDEAIMYFSRFGKVEGLLQPSEGSLVMAHWFGGGHPSQTVSRNILPGREGHLKATLSASLHIAGAPLVTKNAWNCFRVDYLASTLPKANFIWIRRDIAAAAKSDLQARYLVQGDPNTWNSATPANVETLRRRPYSEQVVENQFEFGAAISAAFRRLSSDRRIEIWYEDLIRNPVACLSRIGSQLTALQGRTVHPAIVPTVATGEGKDRLGDVDARLIDDYVADHEQRLKEYRYPGAIQ